MSTHPFANRPRHAPKNTSAVYCEDHPDATLIEDYRAGDTICPECGTVIGDRVIDVGCEWRNFSNDNGPNKDPTRVGAAMDPLLDGGDLTTGIGAATGAASFDENGNAKYRNNRSMSSADRTLLKAFGEISEMGDKINLTRNIVDKAKNQFREIQSKKILKGKNKDAIASACLYIACRQEQVPRTFKEICAISKVSKKDIGRCFKLIVRALETDINLIESNDFMSRFCGNLSLTHAVQRVASHIAKKAVDLDLVPGRSPVSIAAAAIYMAAHASSEARTHKEIEDVAGVAEVTIKQSYRLMQPRMTELFPQEFKFAKPIASLQFA